MISKGFLAVGNIGRRERSLFGACSYYERDFRSYQLRFEASGDRRAEEFSPSLVSKFGRINQEITLVGRSQTQSSAVRFSWKNVCWFVLYQAQL
uniref:Uncharacterized protein n=1 Tax=Ascaris lumbricoides TaxID=6252 RepID=A0A0M3I3Y2_ASCLU